jgi:hypothetical protein
MGQVAFTAAQSSLKANAGPDQTVAENPATVAFSGSANVTNYRCDWYNQWNLRRATNNCAPTFEVNFGKNAKAGTKRTFKLEVTDTQTGQKATDRVTITFIGAIVAPPPDDPAEGHTLTGQIYRYELWGCGGNTQNTTVGTLDDGRWYLQSTGAGEDCIWGSAATVQCLQGTYWKRLENGLVDKEGCVSVSPEKRDLIVLMGIGGWVVIDNFDGTHIAKLTPQNAKDLWLPLETMPTRE